MVCVKSDIVIVIAVGQLEVILLGPSEELCRTLHNCLLKEMKSGDGGLFISFHIPLVNCSPSDARPSHSWAMHLQVPHSSIQKVQVEDSRCTRAADMKCCCEVTCI